ncbi:hypothetical protein EVAR_53186_1 [Eumeta japonica]|uniref:Endonuclease/exonuclease/phosphatase domain-containing protein n=1 Tax=Eumeta variegata TaxID=151549 RepID=A0A4C1YUT2_EUMVA|nr:hypothetical protein EVAR_53186_1 [Eumeta japonica]
MRLPTIVIEDVLKIDLNEDIVASLKTQNQHLPEGLDWEKVRAKVCYRKRARNDLECHPVLESPLVQCSRCLGSGHGKRFCKNVSERCAHCGSEHSGVTCRAREEGKSSKCLNCIKTGCENNAHGAFSSEWDGTLHREYWRAETVSWAHSCPKDDTVKGTRQSPHHNLEQQHIRLNDEEFAAAAIKAGNCRIGVVAVYFEGNMSIGHHLDRMPYAYSKIRLDKIILGSDINAWSIWWSSEHDDARGVDLYDFLDSEGLHILNEGNTPKFKVYGGIVSSRAWWI